jgi:alkylation response protein AidB-like acyl-CoA dehydrogenase
VLVAIQILMNVHGAGSFAESSPTQQFWCDANTAARHRALNTIIRQKVYGKALLGVDEVVTRLV